MRISWAKVEHALRESGLSDSESMRELRNMQLHVRVSRDVQRQLRPFIVQSASIWYYTDKLCLCVIESKPSEAITSRYFGKWWIRDSDSPRLPAQMEFRVSIRPKSHEIPTPKGYTTPWVYELNMLNVLSCRKLY